MINIKKNDEKSYTIDMSLNESKKLTAYQAINNYIYNFNIFENSKIEYMTSEQFLNSKKEKYGFYVYQMLFLIDVKK